ncbi:molybdopterin molybdotransferase MoeA [Poseidonocella sp. HB161398]|uniref:molybdopterin molybdotransferase MoeA n=1 Tax=Poseidonocella sp. HB161398 TaxID=2320855 RepID=UPI001485ED58|nr:molybdopterin molybdotransferase MoeA [Poseidonocella sp. HB161398]
MAVHILYPERGGGALNGARHAPLPLDEALAACASLAAALGDTEEIAAGSAVGRHLAAPVLSRANVPLLPCSAVDGYALRLRDLAGPGPWRLPVAGSVAAGSVPPPLRPGYAVGIASGAPVPQGATAILAGEEVTRLDALAHFSRCPMPSENIRQAGEDLAAGDPVLRAGRCLGRRDVALAAAAGADLVTVRRKVRAALLVTGDGLLDPGDPPGPAGVTDVNGPMLRALMDRPDTALAAAERTAGDPHGIRTALARLAGQADLLVTTGGLSVGAGAGLRAAVEALGGTLHFAGVAMAPGGAVSLGMIEGAIWLGLPGSPLAAFAGWHLFGRAIVAGLQGRTARMHKMVVSPVGEILREPGPAELRPARLVGYAPSGRALVSTDRATFPGRVRPLAESDGLLLIPAAARRLGPADLVEFLPFRDRGYA